MEHQRHARKRHGACSPQLPAVAAAQRQHGNQGHHQHVQAGHKRVAVAAGARQPFNLQPEREEQQQTQRRAPAPFIAVHAQPQGSNTTSAIAKRSQMICSASSCADSSFMAGKVVPHTTVTMSRAIRPERSVRMANDPEQNQKKRAPVARRPCG